MGDGFTMTVKGGPELRRALARLEDATASRLLLAAVVAGALPIQNQAKRNAHKITGTLARSIHIGGFTRLARDFSPAGDRAAHGTEYHDVAGARETRDEAEVVVGTDVPYGRREEMGFGGTDSLGRRYAFAGHPYLRPAFDEKRAEAVHETGEALKELLRKAVRG